jgi:hypothetical protein
VDRGNREGDYAMGTFGGRASAWSGPAHRSGRSARLLDKRVEVAGLK